MLGYTAQSRKFENFIDFNWNIKSLRRNLVIPLEVFCKECFDISNENTSFLTLEDSIWLQIIYLFTAIAFWLVKFYLSARWGDHWLTASNVLRIYFVAFVTQTAIKENSRHCIKKFRLFYNWRIKSSKNFPRNQAFPGLFIWNCSNIFVD